MVRSEVAAKHGWDVVHEGLIQQCRSALLTLLEMQLNQPNILRARFDRCNSHAYYTRKLYAMDQAAQETTGY